MSISLQVAIMAGTDTIVAIREMIELARKMDMPVESRFNGCLLLVFPHSIAEEEEKELLEMIAHTARIRRGVR